MPRQARLDTPGTLHHVIIKGIEKGVNIEAIISGSRRRFVSETMRIIASSLVKEYGAPISEVARRVGVTTSAVSKMVGHNIT